MAVLGQALVAILAVVLVAVTLLPLSRSHAWWVRVWDFPRVQIAIGLAAVLALSPLLPGWLGWSVAVAAAGCLGWQVWRILPFTPLVHREMQFAAGSAPADVTLVGANVLMENQQHDQVLALIRS